MMHTHQAPIPKKTKRHRLRSIVSGVTAALLATTGLAALSIATAPAALAAPNLLCTAPTVYGLDQITGDGDLWAIDSLTGSASKVIDLPGGDIGNQVGIAPGGTNLFFTKDNVVYNYTLATDSFVSSAATTLTGFSSVGGAVNPANGLYYYGGLGAGGTQYQLAVYDPATNTSLGVAATIPLPAGVTLTNSDIAFDQSGRLYIVGSQPDASGRLIRVDGILPTTPLNVTIGSTVVTAIPPVTGVSYAAIAFSSAGDVYVGGGNQVLRIDPNSGAILSQNPIPGLTNGETNITDFGTCAPPPTLTVQKSVGGRALATDQFALAITGGGVQPGPGSTGVTEGTETGVQNQSSTELAGPVIVRADQTYTFGETAAGTTDLANYTASWECVNSLDGTVLGSGAGSSGSIQIPEIASISVLCTISNTPLASGLTLDKRVVSVTDVNGNGLTDLGDEILWEFELTNTGETPLSDLVVNDDVLTAAGIGVTCDPNALAPGESVVCTPAAAYVITQTDVDNGEVVNTATGTGTPPNGPPVVTPPDTTETPVDSLPELALDKRITDVIDVNGNGYNDLGDQIVWAFDLENTGTTTLDAIAVNDDLLTATGIGVTCPTTTLAPGESVTCDADAPYTITQADVDNGQVVNTATATGTPPAGPPVVTPPDDTTTPVGGYTVTKVSDPASGSTVSVGDTITYTVTVTHAGTADVTDASLVDDLTAVLDDATYNDDATASAGTVTVDDATDTLSWDGDLSDGDVVTITYSVTVEGEGDDTLTNVITSDGCTDECTTSHLVGDYTVVKSSDPASGSTVEAGDTVTYTLTVTQGGAAPVTAATLDDDLTAVIDDATYNGDATASGGTVAYDSATSTLSWDGDLAVGAIVTITYSVTVADTGDSTMTNVVTSPGCLDDCTTEHYIGDYTVTKTADPASGSTVAVGQTVTYTVTVTQTGAGAVTGATLSDDLTAVLDDATFGDVEADLGDATFDGSTLAWTGDLPVGAVAHIVYTVTVTGDGDLLLANVVTSPGCSTSCETEHPVGSFVFSKSSDPESGSTVQIGDKVTYTITVSQSGRGPVTGATVVDDLSDVFDDAAWNGTASTTSGNVTAEGNTLTWTGDLAVGAVVTITYSVTVTGGGDQHLANVVTTDDPSGSCDPDAVCETTHRVPPPAGGLAVTGGSVPIGAAALGALLLALGATAVMLRRRGRV